MTQNSRPIDFKEIEDLFVYVMDKLEGDKFKALVRLKEKVTEAFEILQQE
jgi:hypothetical protein